MDWVYKQVFSLSHASMLYPICFIMFDFLYEVITKIWLPTILLILITINYRLQYALLQEIDTIVTNPPKANQIRYREPYMTAYVFLYALNKLKINKMRGMSSSLSFFCSEFNKFNNTDAQLVDSMYYMTFILTAGT